MNELKRFLTNRQPGIQNEGEFFVSAVLLPLLISDNKCQVLFEVRACHLRRQPGEICFPGGGIEGDERLRPQDTAVREAVEELGLDKSQIELLGPLDYVIAPHGTLVYPFVGEIDSGAVIAPNKDEVEEIFLAPVEYFFNNPPAQSSVEVATRYGRDFPYDRVPATYKKGWGRKWSMPVYFYEYEGRFIWGITARILHDFINVYYKVKKE